MDRAPVAWVLNLHAEDEFTASGYFAPKKLMVARALERQASLIGSLVLPGDWILSPGSKEIPPPETLCLAWSPTPWATRIAKKAGLELSGQLPLSILRAVNHKGFAQRVRSLFSNPGLLQQVCHSGIDLERVLTRSLPQDWLVRRPFGTAGRARICIRQGLIGPQEERWLSASFRAGPLLIEPSVPISWEVSTCGWIDGTGQTQMAEPQEQSYDVHGAWQPPMPDPKLDPTDSSFQSSRWNPHRTELRQAAQLVANHLESEGYRGPFGIDAFAYQTPSGTVALNPIGEINARFTMAWAHSHRDLLQRGLRTPTGPLPW